MFDINFGKGLSRFIGGQYDSTLWPPEPTFIDRRHCKRVVPMRVLVLGLSRTGTESIRKALKLLDYDDVYHGYAPAFENPPDCLLWLEAMAAKWDGVGKPYGRQEFDRLLGHCQAVCDVPAACFASELVQAYPEAKVILTLRDIDSWHSSVNAALIKSVFSPGAAIVDFLAKITLSQQRSTRSMFLRIFADFFHGDFAGQGKEVYRNHYETVRKLVPRSNLLEYDVRQGWGPLCQFLEMDEPTIPFPKGNGIKETKLRIRLLVWVQILRLFNLALWATLIVAVILIPRRYAVASSP